MYWNIQINNDGLVACRVAGCIIMSRENELDLCLSISDGDESSIPRRYATDMLISSAGRATESIFKPMFECKYIYP
jgi:hypothetical protein